METTMPKFFITREDVQGSFIVMRNDVHHIVNVLRKEEGDTITVCDGQGRDYECRIMQIAPGEESLVCQILSEKRSDTEPEVEITVYQSLPKGDKMETVIQKGIEVGISGVVPYYSERSLIHLDEKKAHQKVMRWQMIAEAAAKQSGRGLIPEVAEVHTFKQVLKEVADYDLAIVFYENAAMTSLKSLLNKVEKEKGIPQKVAIWIGPEGGFSANEVKALETAGCYVCGLGARILRTETAGIAASVMILYHFDKNE